MPSGGDVPRRWAVCVVALDPLGTGRLRDVKKSLLEPWWSKHVRVRCFGIYYRGLRGCLFR